MPVPNDVIAYSAEELCRLLPIGRAACYRLAHQLGVRVGRRILVPRRALEQWIEGQAKSGKSTGGAA